MATPLNQYTLNGVIRDLGNNTTSAVKRFVVPFNGFLLKVQTVLGAAIAGADAVLTVSRNATALAPTITITQSGSAAGDVDSADFHQPVVMGDIIKIQSDFGNSDAIDVALCDITVTLSK